MAGGATKASVDVQIASEARGLPSAAQLQIWARAALADAEDGAELTVRVVDEAESAELNKTYRHHSGPTNVLSFPFEAPEQITMSLLGDVVICAPVVAAEAREQNKTAEAHFVHMVVHGVLHLRGYDHQDEAGAAKMETEERRILDRLGYPDPSLQSS